jgi:hypothetical protein
MDAKERAELYDVLAWVFKTLANWFSKHRDELKK